jgi:hypothetical protein
MSALGEDDPRFADLRAGRPLEFAAPGRAESDSARAARTIPAAWLNALPDASGRIAVPIHLRRVRIAGDVMLSYCVFGSDVVFIECEFLQATDFSFARFHQRASFRQTQFLGDAVFNGAQTEYAFDIRRASFAKEASFGDMRVGSVFDAAAAKFALSRFHRLRARAIFFNVLTTPSGRAERTHFAGEAFLTDVHVDTNASFQGALFEAAAHFDRIRVNGAVFFNPPRRDRDGKEVAAPVPGVTMRGEATFVEIHVGDTAYFNGITFEDNVDFRSAKFESQALFGALRIGEEKFVTRFFKDAGFQRVHVRDSLECQGVQFGGRASFDLLRVDGNAFFGPASYRTPESQMDRLIEVTRFSHDASFYDARVGGTFRLSAARFRSAAVFDRVRIDGALSAQTMWFADEPYQPWFGGRVAFVDCRIEGSASFEGAEFGAEANFNRVDVANNVFFRSSRGGGRVAATRFFERAEFLEARIGGTADFDGAQFLGDAGFNRMSIGGEAFFRTTARFGYACFAKAAAFNGAVVGGSAHFNGAQFLGAASFVGANVGRNLNCTPLWTDVCVTSRRVGRPPMTLRRTHRAPIGGLFRGPASFARLRTRGDVVLQGVRFLDTLSLEGVSAGGNLLVRPERGGMTRICRTLARKRINLLGARIDGTAEISGLLVVGPLNMVNAQVGSDAQFWRLRCRGSASFRGTVFEHSAEFERAQFRRAVVFDASTSAGIVDFSRTRFIDDVSLVNAHFATVRFLSERSDGKTFPTVFGATIDLRGFRYERIAADWRPLLARLRPYDRQPYQSLERFLRASGDDRGADDVYIARRLTESRDLLARVRRAGASWTALSELPHLVLDTVQKWLRYGVRPVWLLWTIVCMLLLGMVVFHQPGAVVLKDQKSEKWAEEMVEATKRDGQRPTLQVQRAIRGARRDFFREPLRWGEAFGVSARLFVPIVELPFGTEWVPSHEQPIAGFVLADVYASLHRVSGAILVPLAVASLTGLLVRRARPSDGQG